MPAHAHGVDSLQALFQAMQGIRFHLEKSGESLTFFDGEVGDYGIHKALFGHDLAMTQHLERLGLRETTKLTRQAVAKRSRPRRPAPKTTLPPRRARGSVRD